MRDYEHTALADIQRWAGFPGQPLFDSIVVFENYPINAALRSNELYGLRFGDIAGKGLTGYAMDLQVTVGDTLEIEYAYGCNDFTDEFVLELRSHMECLMREMMTYPQRVVGELGGIGKERLAQLFLLRGDANLSEYLVSRLSARSSFDRTKCRASTGCHRAADGRAGNGLCRTE